MPGEHEGKKGTGWSESILYSVEARLMAFADFQVLSLGGDSLASGAGL